MEEAKSELLFAVAADPNDTETHFLLAKVYREQGDSKSSAREMEEFQRLLMAEKEKTYERLGPRRSELAVQPMEE